MQRPKLWKEGGRWHCHHKDIRTTGSTPVEAFLNFILAKATKHLHDDEVQP